jgi:hypothetical protein
MLLQQRVYLKASVQFEKPADLSLGEPTSRAAEMSSGNWILTFILFILPPTLVRREPNSGPRIVPDCP